ncbi:hypothetical protein [Fimbriimonas ginsengisoli]|uniref:Lipoprotein n=1 Tax=Fimbriimonas ginsengisoli Gsoil 348 TaxID=661478 RepID=A0A068NYR5_FIMGI|nr:hypothetical protein [Fimbriimonas ginsengisoli]AIE87284.1 hypothetical protein OP10G_3916 [Fimbriimonas ginsengisoli Gsoil 348]
MTKRIISLAILALSATYVAGCAKPEEPVVTTPPATAGTASTTPDTKPANGGQVFNTPPAEGTQGGYRIAPKDPNDPHFKQDPKLAGGG